MNFLKLLVFGVVALGLSIAEPQFVLAQSEVPAYEAQDVSKVAVSNKKDDGTFEYSLDLDEIDKIIKALETHALNYPTRFRNDEDKHAARTNAVQLQRVMQVVLKDDAETKMFYQSAIANNIAHNLGVKGAAEEADRCYQVLLEREPENVNGNYRFGVFLASSARVKKSIPYLQKAQKLEHPNAEYSLGMAYAASGEKEFALKCLNSYAEKNPENKNVKRMIEAVESGKIKNNVERLGGSQKKSDR